MNSQTTTIGFELDKYPTLKRAAESNALIRLVSGPAGSAKTSFAIMEMLRLSLLQEPAPIDNTRYTRVLVVRNTYSLLKSNTIPSIRNMYGPLIKLTDGSQPTGVIKNKLSDGTFLHIDFQFLALDSEDAHNKLLGAEPTFVLLDELNMMPESVVFAIVRRLGRYPSKLRGSVTRTGIVGVFNGPVKGSWLHKWYLGEKDEVFEKVGEELRTHSTGVRFDRFMEWFRQPPALLRPPASDPEANWLPNPQAENIHNLPQGYGYYYMMLADPDPAKIQAFVEGEFADIKHGKVVFPEFSRQLHTFAHIDTRQIREYYLSFDFGRTPVCLVSYLAMDGSIVVLDEFMGEDVSVDTLYRQQVLPALKRHYPNATCVQAFGDPAGLQRTQAVDISPFGVLRKLGVPIIPPTRNNQLEPRLQAVRQFIATLGHNGKPKLRISERCSFLIQAMASDYIYEQKRGSGYSETPTKTHAGWASDLCFAAGTLVITDRGNVPIEQLRVGDKVLTRNGFRRVTGAACTSPDALTYEYHIGDRVLWATPNHPVYANGEWVAIDELVGRTVYCILSVIQNLPRINIANEQHVASIVGVHCYRKRKKHQPVYDISVEGAHEFFANGVLVHNCDALQYMCLGMLHIGSEDAPTYDRVEVDWYD